MESTRLRQSRTAAVAQPQGESEMWKHIQHLHSKVEELRLAHEEREEKPQKELDHLGHAAAAIGMVKGLEAAFKPLEAAIARDAQNDASVAQRLESLDQCIRELNACMAESQKTQERLIAALEGHARSLDEHAATMRTPKTRTGRVMTPEGPLEMTVTEAREARKGH